MFLGASQVKLFYFTPFGRKRLQTAPEAGGEALPNGALEPLWQGSYRGFSSGSCWSCAKHLFWKGFRIGSRSRAGAIFCLRRRSLENELRAVPCCGFTSSSAKEPFCQTFSKMASAPPEKLLLQRSQRRSHFQRSQSPAKQALSQSACFQSTTSNCI